MLLHNSYVIVLIHSINLGNAHIKTVDLNDRDFIARVLYKNSYLCYCLAIFFTTDMFIHFSTAIDCLVAYDNWQLLINEYGGLCYIVSFVW